MPVSFGAVRSKIFRFYQVDREALDVSHVHIIDIFLQVP